MLWDLEPDRTISCCICNTNLSDGFRWFLESPLSPCACIGTLNPPLTLLRGLVRNGRRFFPLPLPVPLRAPAPESPRRRAVRFRRRRFTTPTSRFFQLDCARLAGRCGIGSAQLP